MHIVFINWVIGTLSKKGWVDTDMIYPMVFSIHENEIYAFLHWMRHHQCPYTKDNAARRIFKRYCDNEILENRLVSLIFEQFGSSRSKPEGSISIELTPSSTGTSYRLKCKCGDNFEPG